MPKPLITPRGQHTRGRLDSIGRGFAHVLGLRHCDHLTPDSRLACGIGIGPGLRTGSGNLQGAHEFPGGLYAILRPGDPRYEALCPAELRSQSIATPVYECWKSQRNRTWTEALSRRTNIVPREENHADSRKEMFGERGLFGLLANRALWRSTGHVSDDIGRVQNLFWTDFLPTDIMIIEKALQDTKTKLEAAPTHRKPFYQSVAQALEIDWEIETRMLRVYEPPDTLETATLHRSIRWLVSNES